MFLLVSKFKMIGMLLNVVHGQVQRGHSTLLTMIELTDHDWRRALD